MNALISGEMGMGWILDGSFPRSVITPHDITPSSAALEDVVLWLSNCYDCIFLERTDSEAAQKELIAACAKEEIKRLFLIFTHDDLEHALRIQLAKSLDKRLKSSDQLRDVLNALLYSKPIPTSVNLTVMGDMAEQADATYFSKLLRQLDVAQPIIRRVAKAWDQVPAFLFNTLHEKEVFFETLKDAGSCLRFVIDVNSNGNASQFLLSELARPEIRNLQRAPEIISEWTKPFRPHVQLEDIGPDLQFGEQTLVEADLDTKIRRRFGSFRNLIAEITQRKEATRDRIRRGHADAAMKHARRLVLFQTEFSRPSDIAGSLSELAAYAKSEGLLNLAVDLLNLASNATADNYLIWSQLGSVLRRLGFFSEALTAYEKVIANNPSDVAAKCARAEIFRDQNEPQRALEAYDRIIQEHPEDLIAKRSRAKVLREVRRFDEALSAFDQVILEDPEDWFAQRGRAATLHDLNRLREANEAYDIVIGKNANDVVAKNGRAQVLRDLNMPLQALEAYVATMREHPQDTYSKNGQAEVLRDLNRSEEALIAYEANIRAHPEDTYAKNGKAEVLWDLGRPHEALRAYEQAIEAHPDDIVARCGRAEVLRDLNKPTRALQAYNSALLINPSDVFALCGRAGLLLQLNGPAAALKAYEHIIDRYPFSSVARNGLAMALMKLKQFEKALAQLSIKYPRSREDWISYHVKGMIYLRMREWDSAIEIFENGVNANLPPTYAGHYYAALALCKLRKNRWRDSLGLLDHVTPLRLRTPVNVIRAHVFGVGARPEECRRVIREVTHVTSLAIQDVVREIDRRYVRKKPKHTEEWLFNREEDLLLVA